MNVKSIIKMVALALAGVAAITAVGFGVKAIVDYTKTDLKTISPTFEVGNLGADGKFVEDKSTLYTKEAFGCYGLQVKPDFDSTVNYQIYYYDILDNYISSTEIMSDGYSGEAPLNGAYARIVIEPKDDEDGKISFTEKVKYSKQLILKIKKEQRVNERFVNFKGKILQVENNTSSLVFTNNLGLDADTLTWKTANNTCVTSTVILKVNGGETLNFDKTALGEDYSKSYMLLSQFKGVPLEDNVLSINLGDNYVLDKKTKYLIITLDSGSAIAWTDTTVTKLSSCITITK